MKASPNVTTVLAAGFLFSLMVGCAPSASAQPARDVTERSYAEAVASFRQARFAEAYGRLIRLADAGHRPSAELALWMYCHGAPVFGHSWDSTPKRLAHWAQLSGQPAPASTSTGGERVAALLECRR
jgi:hypothetical protein